MKSSRKILFIGEAVSLAHVSRPLVLARSLDKNLFDIHFACDPRYHNILKEDSFKTTCIKSISSEQFLTSVEKGTQLFTAKTISSYVQEEIELINKIKPDLIIGDFRVSLGVSAPYCKVPYFSICNAHWSPFAGHKRLPLPDYTLGKPFGKIADKLFPIIQPIVLSYHAAALNKVRKRYGLKAFNSFFEGFTYGDHVLYADTPNFVPTYDKAANHHYIGPVSWSPQIDLPKWWNEIDESKPIIYMTLGSTGSTENLEKLILSLAKMPVSILASTAGRETKLKSHANIKIEPYLPGDKATARSSLVICNGGSATTYAALRQGVPIVGVASNMDQLLTMSYVKKARAGILIRPSELNVSTLESAVLKILDSDFYKLGVKKVAKDFAEYNSNVLFKTFIDNFFDLTQAKTFTL